MSGKIILITGANRGIGFAILQGLAQTSPLNTYILGCRKKVDGSSAIDRLRLLDIKSQIEVVEIDVTSDTSLRTAAEEVRSKFGKLDILINNAGISLIPKQDHSDFREIFNRVYDTNVSSVAMVMAIFLPLMKETSSDPRIINVSSTTGSFGLAYKFPSISEMYMPYTISKTAENMLTLWFTKLKGNEGITIQSGAPGLCRTELNDASKTAPNATDPLDGAKVFVELALAEKGKHPNGFWYMDDDESEPH